MQWLVISVGLSLILTVLLNVALRAFPGAGHRIARSRTTFTSPSADDLERTTGGPARVFVPWKAMILASLILTVVVNVLLWIT